MPSPHSDQLVRIIRSIFQGQRLWGAPNVICSCYFQCYREYISIIDDDEPMGDDDDDPQVQAIVRSIEAASECDR